MFKIGNDKPFRPNHLRLLIDLKHYRMTEESLKFIEMRDKQKYPKESLFVNAAIQYFGRGIEQENLMDELEEMQDKLDRIENLLEENASKKKELIGKPDYF